jgi:hypothetical protein
MVSEMNGWNPLNPQVEMPCAIGSEAHNDERSGGVRGGWRLLADVPN